MCIIRGYDFRFLEILYKPCPRTAESLVHPQRYTFALRSRSRVVLCGVKLCGHRASGMAGVEPARQATPPVPCRLHICRYIVGWIRTSYPLEARSTAYPWSRRDYSNVATTMFPTYISERVGRSCSRRTQLERELVDFILQALRFRARGHGSRLRSGRGLSRCPHPILWLELL